MRDGVTVLDVRYVRDLHDLDVGYAGAVSSPNKTICPSVLDVHSKLAFVTGPGAVTTYAYILDMST